MQVKSEDRDRICQRFNNVEQPQGKAVLISIGAGNMGINLPAANHVVLFDCGWNPAEADQVSGHSAAL